MKFLIISPTLSRILELVYFEFCLAGCIVPENIEFVTKQPLKFIYFESWSFSKNHLES